MYLPCGSIEASFQDPTNYMYALLTNTRRLSTHSHKHDLANVEERKDRTLSKIRDGRKRVQSEIADFRDKLELAKDTIARLEKKSLQISKCCIILDLFPQVQGRNCKSSGQGSVGSWFWKLKL